MNNELLFIIHTLLIGLITQYAIIKKNKQLLTLLFSIFFIIINIFSHLTTTLFGITTTRVEPFAVGLFWISIYCFRLFGNDGRNAIIQSMWYTSGIYLGSYSVIHSYNKNCFFDSGFLEAPLSIIISMITFYIVYYCEQKIYMYCSKKFTSYNSQLISTLSGQILDSTIFSLLFFGFRKQIHEVFSIIIFSIIIKLLCIIINSIIERNTN
jgi:uncharacterized PurR-regulated membrane protein YhhQ (DUF165 family)